MTGIIKTYSAKDYLLKQLPYHSIWERRNIMDRWRNQHIGQSYFQIDIHSVRIKEKPDSQKEKIIRFPAKYDNDNKSLYKND